VNSAKALSDMLGDGRSVLWMLAGSSNSFSDLFFTNNGRFAVHFSPCEIQSSGRPGFWSLLMLGVEYRWFLGYERMLIFSVSTVKNGLFY
jgi:hypothetical protein